MIKLKQYAASVQPTISIESELAQLESVVIALEAAQSNPEISTLLFGPSIGLEDGFGAKVKDTAKKLWEALVAFIKKLIGWGKKTEEKAEEVLADIKENAEVWRAPFKEVTAMDLEMEEFEQGVRNYDTFSSMPQPMPEKWVSKFETLDGKVAWHLFHYYVKTHSGLFNESNVVTFATNFVELSKAIQDEDDSQVKVLLLELYDNSFAKVRGFGHVDRADLYNDPWKHIKHLVSSERQHPRKVEPFNFKKHVFSLQANSIIPWIDKLTKDLNTVNDNLLRCTEKLSSTESEQIDSSTMKNLGALKDLARIYEKHVSDQVEFYRAVDKAMTRFKK